MVVKKVNEINLKIPLIFFFCFITLYFVYLFFQLLKKMITQSTGYFWFTQSFLPSCIFCDQLIFYNLSKALCYFWFFLWNKAKQMQKGFYGRTKVTCPDLKSGIRRWERRGGGSFIKGPSGLHSLWPFTKMQTDVTASAQHPPPPPPPPPPSPSPGVVGAARLLPAIQHGVERDGALAGPPLGNNSDDALFTHNWNRSRR